MNAVEREAVERVVAYLDHVSVLESVIERTLRRLDTGQPYGENCRIMAVGILEACEEDLRALLDGEGSAGERAIEAVANLMPRAEDYDETVYHMGGPRSSFAAGFDSCRARAIVELSDAFEAPVAAIRDQAQRDSEETRERPDAEAHS